MALFNPTIPRPKRATIYEVARLAGVSHVTVSRAFSKTASISDATRKKIQSAVQSLDYRPNPLARGLNGATTYAISIVWPMGRTFISENSISTLVTKFQRRGYHTQMANTLNRIDMTKEVLESLLLRSVDAIVLNITPEILDGEIVDLLKRFRAPLVVAAEPLGIEIDQIVWNRATAIKEAVVHFANSGRKNIAHIGLAKAESGSDRLHEQYKADAFLDSLKSCGVKCSQDNLILFDYGFSPYDVELTREFFQKRFFVNGFEFDAVLCSNDWVAVIMMQMLEKHGLNVPEDVAVIGYDDSDLVKLSRPPLASVNRCNDKLIEVIDNTLFERLDDPDLPLQKKQVNMRFVYRESADALCT